MKKLLSILAIAFFFFSCQTNKTETNSKETSTDTTGFPYKLKKYNF